MRIQLEGACNARDLGGIKSKFGVIKRGRLLRSGELSRLSQKDVETLKAVPLTRIVDLRTSTEMANSPDVKIDGVIYENISIIRATTFGITYEKSTGSEIADMLAAGFERMKARNETYSQHMELLYRKFVNDDHSRKGYGQFLKLLANSPIDGATLWHCTVGKDRVGTCTALLLHCLGVEKQDIFHDYLLTNEQSQENRNSILNKVKPFVSSENLAMIETMLSADKAYLDTFYEETEQFGGIDGFIAECSVTETDIEKLRENYLD